MTTWKIVTLEDVTATRSEGLRRGPFGGAIKKDSFVADGYKIYEQKHAIYGNFNDGSYYISDQKFQELKVFSIEPNDLLVSCSGTLGRIAIVPSAVQPGIINQALLRIRPDTSKVSPIFLKLLLETPDLQTRLFGNAGGSAIKNVKPLSELRQTKFLLPPLVDQCRIADVLERAEALRAKRRASLTELDSLTPSIFLEKFGDPLKNPKSWQKEKLGNLMRIRRGGSPRPIDQFLGGTINWIKIGDATTGDDIYILQTADKITEAGLNKTVFLKTGSMIFANCGVSLGFARILKIDGCIHDGWLSFEEIPEDRLDKIFLLKALNAVTTRFRKMAPEGTQPNLNTDLMKNFEIILPPLPIQRQFAGQVSALEHLKSTYRASLAELDALFASLQHRAFRGELWNEQPRHEQPEQLRLLEV